MTASSNDDHSVLKPRQTSADNPSSVTKLMKVNTEGFVKSECNPPFSEYIAFGWRGAPSVKLCLCTQGLKSPLTARGMMQAYLKEEE